MTILPRRPTTASSRQLEWFSAIVMAGWAAILALPGDSLSAPQFATFHRLGLSEFFWTVVFGLICAMRFTALYINGRNKRTPYARMAGALFGFISWGQVAIQVTIGGWTTYNAISTGLAPYGALALAELYSLYRAGYDAGYDARYVSR